LFGTNASQPPHGKIEISQITIRTKEPARALSAHDIIPLVLQGRWDEARWHLKQLIPSDDPLTNYNYGRLRASGLGGNQDYQEAANCFRKDTGLPEARVELAKLYFYGLGVPRDQSKAVRLLQMEATANQPEANYVFGLAYSFGMGTEKNEKRATRLVRYAAEHGHAHSMHELARRLIQTEPGEAYYWYKLARESITTAPKLICSIGISKSSTALCHLT
jgi:TPR repeat protein